MRIDIPLDLEPSELDMCCELVPEFFNPDTVGPRLKEINFDEEFKKDLAIGKGFEVTEKPFKKKMKDREGNIVKKGLKNMHGLHSPAFGSDWQDDNAFATRYSCECGSRIGKVFEGTRCPKCGKKVKYVDVDMSLFAWIHIKNPKFKLINPLMFKKLDAFLGKNVLENIIKFQKDLTLDGKYKRKENIDYNKQPYFGIGMVELYNQFDDIMKYYAAKNKHKAKFGLYKDLIRKKDSIFSSSVPVYSAVLRQVFITDEDVSYSKIDRYYNSLFGNVSRLNECLDEVNLLNVMKINQNLYRAQTNLNNAFEEIFKGLTNRDGLIRRQILGGRINFSARTVIVPNAKLKAYQIELPYVAFVEMFKKQIINVLVRMQGCSYSEARNQWQRGYKAFDKKIYGVIKYILKNSKTPVKILLNRNPTINFGSFMVMDIKKVKKEYTDLSTGLPIASLQSLNADFDGDVLNIIELVSEEFKKEFGRIISPKKSFCINRNNGKINTDFALIKDQQIALYEFCTC